MFQFTYHIDMKKTFYLIFAVGILAFSTTMHAQDISNRVLSLEDAQRISDAAMSRAMQDSWNVVIAVLDGGGHLVSLRRMDGTQIGSVDVALKKAETALKFKRPSKVFEDAVKSGNLHILSLPGIVAVEGGLPIMQEGRPIGSIGISGVTSAQDGIIAAAGLEAF
ncbi:MAG: heme-binding protein [Cyclobacteriaceae bacterium]